MIPTQTDKLPEKAKNDLIVIHRQLYKEALPLTVSWDKYQIFKGQSTDCRNRQFEFILISFDNHKEGQAIVIYRKKRWSLEMVRTLFTLEECQKVYEKALNAAANDFWNCNVH